MRSHEEAGGPAKLRPTMISAKYRLKEERRKVLKISIAKLRKIEDPESSLRRSVLINNTMKRLQREAREEKLLKQFPRAPAPAPAPAPTRKRPFDEVDDCDVQDVLSQFYMPPTPRMLTSIDDADEEERERERGPEAGPDPEPEPEVDVVECEGEGAPTAAKRARLEGADDPLELLTAAELGAGPADVDMTLALHAAGLATRVADPAPAPDRDDRLHHHHHHHHHHHRLLPGADEEGATATATAAAAAAQRLFCRPDWAASPPAHTPAPAPDLPADPHQYSCGHSSIFGEIQSVVYHSLIASLES